MHNAMIAAVFAAIILLTSCQVVPRAEIAPEERVTTYNVTFTGTRKQGYDAIEVGLARIYNSPNDVVQVKQPDNGRIIVKALSQVFVIRDPDGMGLANVTGRLPYLLDVTISDNAVVLRFEVTGPSTNGEYPMDMVQVHRYFDRLATDLSATFGGSLAPGQFAPPAPPAPAPTATPAPTRGR
jgi:hypothetical protein